MKKLLSIIIVSLLLSANVYSKEINLSCDLSKFLTKKFFFKDLKQIPLSQVDSTYLKKVTLSFDLENEKFLGSNLIYGNEYKSVLFTDDEIFFMTKGYKDNKDIL